MITNKTQSKFALAACCLILSLLTSCSKGKDKQEDTSTTIEEEYIAEHDIAMTVSSLADAISVGETLSPTDYDYKGVLTDGSGMPIYTDINGTPGEWIVEIKDKYTASIQNTNGGDLIPASVVQYIISNTRIDAANRQIKNEETDEFSEEIYLFEGGEICFETKYGICEDGEEYPQMTIRVSAIK